MFRCRRRFKRRLTKRLSSKYQVETGIKIISRHRRRILKLSVSVMLIFVFLTTMVFDVQGATEIINIRKSYSTVDTGTDSKKSGRSFGMSSISSIDEQYDYSEYIEPIELIPVEELVISQEDLSTPKEEKKSDSESNTVKVKAPSNEVSRLVYGMDVSKWQGDIDWSAVKADGIEFAMIKMGGRDTAMSGGLYVDSKFERNIQGAIANGIQVGIYFFSQAINEYEAFEEASMLINYISKYQITYPVAFDWESASGYRVANYGLSAAALTGIVNVFCDTVKSYGYTPMVYFNRSDWYNAVNAGELTSKYKSWLAIYFGEYYNNPDAKNWYRAGGELPGFSYPYQMWQYTSRGHVAGIGGFVDLDIAFFGYSYTPAPSSQGNSQGTVNTALNQTTSSVSNGASGSGSISKSGTGQSGALSSGTNSGTSKTSTSGGTSATSDALSYIKNSTWYNNHKKSTGKTNESTTSSSTVSGSAVTTTEAATESGSTVASGTTAPTVSTVASGTTATSATTSTTGSTVASGTTATTGSVTGSGSTTGIESTSSASTENSALATNKQNNSVKDYFSNKKWDSDVQNSTESTTSETSKNKNRSNR